MRSLAVLAGVLLLQEPPDDASRKLAERAERASGWLSDADAELRQMGLKEVRELGSAAVPALEKRLAERGLLDLAQAWKESTTRGETFVRAEELEEVSPDDPAIRELRKIERSFIDQYARAKYAEALGFVRKKSYSRASTSPTPSWIWSPRRPWPSRSAS
jgi:hypothetical protein